MTKQADRLAARAAKATAPAVASSAAVEQETPRQRHDEQTAINTRKVRTTVVLDPVEYDALGDLCRELERATGRRGVAASEIMRVLLSITRAEDDLGGHVRTRVRQHIEREGGNRRR